MSHEPPETTDREVPRKTRPPGSPVRRISLYKSDYPLSLGSYLTNVRRVKVRGDGDSGDYYSFTQSLSGKGQETKEN